ncbi:MAG: transcriptional regulator GcvA [Geminicoccaceae bacterium]
MSRLPPLNAMRSFEAAARLLSFTKAADELFVTQAAISHQVKALEQDLGVPLFRRLNRALALTDEGQALLPFVRGAFEQLTAGVRELEQFCNGGALTVTATPSFASEWLVPRLGRLQCAHPAIDLRLNSSIRTVDLMREGFDCGIRHGLGGWPGLRADRLFQASMKPVCSPALLAGDKPLRTPADLARHTLLHALDGLDEWQVWLRAAGVEGIDVGRGLRFDDGELAMKAAQSGVGVAIGRRPLIDDDLASGRLVEPFDLSLDYQAAYYLITPEATADQPKIAAFRDWLLEEAGRTEAANERPDQLQSKG